MDVCDRGPVLQGRAVGLRLALPRVRAARGRPAPQPGPVPRRRDALRAEDAGGLAQALPRHAAERRPRAGGDARGVLPDDAPGPGPPARHHQQRAQRGHVHGPARGGRPAPGPGEARAALHRSDRDPAPAPPGLLPLRGSAGADDPRRRGGAGDGHREPARQRGEVLEGPQPGRASKSRWERTSTARRCCACATRASA